MRKLIVMLMIAAFAGLASASSFVFDVASFDYSDTDIESAYVQLDMVDGQIRFTFSDTELDSDMPTIVTSVPEPIETDRHGDDILPTFADLGAIEQLKAGRDTVGVFLLHEGTDIDALSECYLTALTDLGFEVTLEHEGMNSATYTFTHGDEVLRVIFDNEGGGTVEAYLRYM
jgi:hypothetical protein